MAEPIASILLVEDNSTDVLLVRQAFDTCPDAVQLHVVSDGHQALDYLYRRSPFEAAREPAFVLLDVNLPRCNGWEVLEEVKQHPTLRRIPIIVLTTSNGEDDIARAYDLHANSYMVKPMAFDEFCSAIGKLNRFWLHTAQLPGGTDDEY